MHLNHAILWSAETSQLAFNGEGQHTTYLANQVSAVGGDSMLHKLSIHKGLGYAKELSSASPQKGGAWKYHLTASTPLSPVVPI